MCPVDDRADRPEPGVGAPSGEMRERVAAIETELAELRAEVAELRRVSAARAPAARAAHGIPHSALASANAAMHAMSGVEIESLVGRYGTLLLAALVILMGVGVVIRVAVTRGLLTPEVSVALGALATVVVGGVGVYFHRRGEVRYGNVLLALALAMTDLVAWGAGPRLALVATPVALAIVTLVSAALAALALHDASEFLFAVAVAGALSAPFVTAERPGSAAALLAYGAVVLLGAQRAVRAPGWLRAFAVLVGGALLYALAAAGLPAVDAWYGPYLILLFAGVCALGALVLAERGIRGSLARAYLAVGLLGVPVGWDRMLLAPAALTLAVALAIAGVTYAALATRSAREELWAPSAIVLPALGLAVAWTGVSGRSAQAAVLAVASLAAFAAWRRERRVNEPDRGGVHLFEAGVMGAGAVTVLLWPHPLLLAAGLAGWGTVLAAAVRDETSPLPLVALAGAYAAAAATAMDQLASRNAYGYRPFLTRSSASALCVALGLAAGAAVVSRGRGRMAGWVDRPARLGVVIGFVILWGRMELAHAFTPDLSTFLLIAYYAGCGVASIVAGRQLGVQPLRLAGLALAIYAAVKAVVEAAEIGGLALRVGAYGAVGVFLLGAGYLYRERRELADPGVSV